VVPDSTWQEILDVLETILTTSRTMMLVASKLRPKRDTAAVQRVFDQNVPDEKWNAWVSCLDEAMYAARSFRCYQFHAQLSSFLGVVFLNREQEQGAEKDSLFERQALQNFVNQLCYLRLGVGIVCSHSILSANTKSPSSSYTLLEQSNNLQQTCQLACKHDL